MPASVRMIDLHEWRKVRTVAFDPKLPLWYPVSSSEDVHIVVCEGYDVAYVELFGVVIKH